LVPWEVMTPNPPFDEYEWHEWRAEPGERLGKPKKQARLLADANIHDGIPLFLVGRGIRVETVKELHCQHHADESIYQLAQRRGRVILTNDSDLWDDRKHPLQGCPGLLFLDAGSQEGDGTVRALLRFEYFLHRKIEAEWWWDTKVRVTENGMVIRCRTVDGQTGEWECRHLPRQRPLWRRTLPRRPGT
jgi:predicted nuclease of predicted toxin-antitoxin system